MTNSPTLATMHSFILFPLLALLCYALPQATSNCVTVTSELVVPTTTVTFTTTHVTTVHATTPENLGTFTLVVTESSTKTLGTITTTITDCTASGTIIAPTVYTTSSAHGPVNYLKRQASCTVTRTFTTFVGQTETYVAASGKTSTFTDYTAFTQETVTSTKSGGTTYTIATAVATETAACGTGATVFQDARCAPSALISEYDGFGLDKASDVPAGGASYSTTTSDAGECCQLCAETEHCAASSWDIRTGGCKLEFPVSPTTGDLDCGEGLLAYYDAGPVNPLAPGAGLFVATLCGNVAFGAEEPDDQS